jgi:hypothetical protein
MAFVAIIKGIKTKRKEINGSYKPIDAKNIKKI